MRVEYPETYNPKHHRAKKNGCVDTHILVAEKLIGRNLKDCEVVHHKDRNRNNYSIDNLIVFATLSDHARYHKNGICIETIEKNVFVSPEIKTYCIKCGNETRQSKSGLCNKCYPKTTRKVERQSKEELINLVNNYSMVKIGKMFGVTDNAIRKWCNQYGINWKK